MLRQASIAPALALGLVLLAGCGNSRTPVPSVTPAAPRGLQTLRYGPAGVELQAPSNWSVEAQQLPLVTFLSSGAATVAIWRFPRTRPPPPAGAVLARARARLIDAVRARDTTLQLIRSKLVTVESAPGIELDAIEQIQGQRRRVRSTHVFVDGAELVLDEYAPPSGFHSIDHAVFSPLKRSLRLFSPTAA